MKLESVINMMLAGRRFNLQGIEMFYKDNCFQFKTYNSEGVLQSFENVEDWELLNEWYDTIPSCGILCMVSDFGSNQKYPRLVISYDGKCFEDYNGCTWDKAVPLKYNHKQFAKNT